MPFPGVFGVPGASASIQDDGVDVSPHRDKLNFVNGTVVDNPANNRTDVKLANQRIQDLLGTIYPSQPILRLASSATAQFLILDFGPDYTLVTLTVPEMVGADASNDGFAGLVPTPFMGDVTDVLRRDGTWGPASLPAISRAILQHQLSNNTAGGATASGAWTTRALNTEVYDPDSIVTLASNQFTLVAGTYRAFAEAAFNQHATNNGVGRLRIRDASTPTTIYTGNNYRMLQNQGVQMFLNNVYFTTDGSISYELQYYLTQLRATDGMGPAVNEGVGTVESYATVILEKVA